MNFDDFRRRISAVLFEAWVTDAGLTEDEIRGFFAHGIPAEWAAAIEGTFAGAVRVADWPKVIVAPHRRAVLHKRLRSSSVNGDMDAEQRLAISKGQSGDEAFRRAIRAKGYTQNGLARAVGVSPAVLSLHRNELRKIPRARAEAIAKLTGWPADGKHWPCGIASDGE